MKPIHIAIFVALLQANIAAAKFAAYVGKNCSGIADAGAGEWLKDLRVISVMVTKKTEGHPGRGPDFAAVYGKEDRITVDKPVHPWTAVGQLHAISLGKSCSATLISECIVLTAGHCVYYKEDGEQYATTFKPRFSGDLEYHFVRKAVVPPEWHRTLEKREEWANKFESYSKDWALLKVSGRPGRKHGYVAVKSGWFDRENLVPVTTNKFYVAGYSADFSDGKLSVDENSRDLRVEKARVPGPMLWYKTDSGKGSSGGPVFEREDGTFYLIGVNARAHVDENDVSKPVFLPEENPEYWAAGVPADYFFDEFLKLREDECDD